MMNKIESRIRCLELSCSIARDTGYLVEHKWERMTNHERSEVFLTILKMADDFSNFASKESE